MLPVTAEVQVLQVRKVSFAARGDKPAADRHFVDFLVPNANEAPMSSMLFEQADVDKFRSVTGKVVKANIQQSIYNGRPQYRLTLV